MDNRLAEIEQFSRKKGWRMAMRKGESRKVFPHEDVLMSKLLSRLCSLVQRVELVLE